jgi:two-component system response regulator FixJ
MTEKPNDRPADTTLAGPDPGCGHSPPAVHVVDDDEAVRHALALLLQSAHHPVVTHSCGVAFLEAFSRFGADAIGCLLTDVRMPGLDGVTLLQRLRGMGFTRPVIVMTAQGDVATAVRAMKAGALDFIEKPFDDDVLLELIEATLAVPETNHAAASEGSSAAKHEVIEAARRIGELSPREREVLNLLVAGKPNKLVAYELGISQRTAEVHRARLMARLGVRSLAEAVRLAVRAELAAGGAEAPASDE